MKQNIRLYFSWAYCMLCIECTLHRSAQRSMVHVVSLAFLLALIVADFFPPVAVGSQSDDDCYSAVMQGRQLLINNDYVKALSAFRAAQKLQPIDARPYFWIGYCLERTNDLNGAVKAYADCLDAAKLHAMDSAELRIDLGNTLCRLNYFKEAVYDYRRALAIDPSLTVAHLCLARVYIETKDYNGALQELDFCISHSFPAPEIGFLKALALQGTGSRVEALAQLRSFIAEQKSLQNSQIMARAMALEAEWQRQ